MPEEFDRRRILIVDDEERMVRFIRMNLEHDGFQVAEAFNGKQAIQKLRDVNPDLILLASKYWRPFVRVVMCPSSC